MSDVRPAADTVAVLHAALTPRSVVDIGSTDERWAAAFRKGGAEVVVVPPSTLPVVFDRRFDLALSIGGPEERPVEEAVKLVTALCEAAEVVALARDAPTLVPPATVTAPSPLPWDRLFEHHGYVRHDRGGVGEGLPRNVEVYAPADALAGTVGRMAPAQSGPVAPAGGGPPDPAAWRLVQKQLLDSESRADKRHRDAVLLWAALVATQRQLVAATYRLARTPDGRWLDGKTLFARTVTGVLPLRRSLPGVLGPGAPLWDRKWYLARYPDVAGARLSPLWHYRRHGAPTRRSPHPWVDPAWYAAHNPEVLGTGADPVEHYFRKGWKEGRDPHPLFDSRWYESQTSGIRSRRRSVLGHYLRHGRGRSPHPLIDPDFYRRSNPAVAATGEDPVEHFLTRGWFEGRDPHPLFDVRWYLETYVDVAREGLNPLVHYLAVGWEQGCDPHPMFDSSWYLKTYPDVADAEREPLTHFVTVGAAEGRAPGPLFDTAWYVERHPEAAAEGRNPLAFFVTEGVARGDAPGPWAEGELHTDLGPARALINSFPS